MKLVVLFFSISSIIFSQSDALSFLYSLNPLIPQKHIIKINEPIDSIICGYLFNGKLKHTFEYDSYNNKVLHLQQIWGSNSWANSKQNKYTFDSFGNVITLH